MVHNDYLALLQAEMVRVLPTRSLREKEAFSNLALQEQAWRFMNWQSRLVHPHPRQVNKVKEFDCLSAVQANRQAVELLLSDLALGKDVARHLSRDVNQGYCLHPPGKKDGPDFDLLLNEWGIHHLHLASKSNSNGGAVKGGDLLYAIIGRGVVFALAVGRHGLWTSKQLIEATVGSWPDQRLFVPLKGILPGRDWSDDQRRSLRKHGATTLAEINGQVWFSGVTGGITTALVSSRVSRQASKLLRTIHQAQAREDLVSSQLRVVAEDSGLEWPSKPEIVLRWAKISDRYCFCFVEAICGVAVAIETD